MKTIWQKKNKPWSEYPIGTKARQSWEGDYWIKVEHGWKWHCGSTFAIPGAANEVCEPMMVPSQISSSESQTPLDI